MDAWGIPSIGQCLQQIIRGWRADNLASTQGEKKSSALSAESKKKKNQVSSEHEAMMKLFRFEIVSTIKTIFVVYWAQTTDEMWMVHLISRPPENPLLCFDASDFFFSFWLDIPLFTSSKPHFRLHVPGLVLHPNQFSVELAAVLARGAWRASHGRQWRGPTSEHKWPVPRTPGQESLQLIRGKTREDTLNGNDTLTENKK